MKACHIYPTGQPAVRWEGDNIDQIKGVFPDITWIFKGDILAQYPATEVESIARAGDWIIQDADGGVRATESMDSMFLWDGEYETYIKLRKRFPGTQVTLIMPFHVYPPDRKHVLMLMVEDEVSEHGAGVNLSIIQPWYWLVPDPNHPTRFMTRTNNRDTAGRVTYTFYSKTRISDQPPTPSEVNEYWPRVNTIEAIQWTGHNSADVIEFCPKCHLLTTSRAESRTLSRLLLDAGDRLIGIPIGNYIIRNLYDGEYTTLPETEFLCRYTPTPSQE